MCHVCRSSETYEGAWNMMYCFILSQVIFLSKFLLALNESVYTAHGNSTSEKASMNETSNITNTTTPENDFFMKANPYALKWAVGLLVTELVSVFLIAWSLSILYRLACS